MIGVEDMIGVEEAVAVAAAVATVILTCIGTLVAIILNQIFSRLRSLGHEDRDIRNQLHGTVTIITQFQQDVMSLALKLSHQIDGLRSGLSEDETPETKSE